MRKLKKTAAQMVAEAREKIDEFETLDLIERLNDPDLVIVDGGKGQVSAAHRMDFRQLSCPARNGGVLGRSRQPVLPRDFRSGQAVRVSLRQRLAFGANGGNAEGNGFRCGPSEARFHGLAEAGRTGRVAGRLIKPPVPVWPDWPAARDDFGIRMPARRRRRGHSDLSATSFLPRLFQFNVEH